jgi:iron complex transport system permease protein
MIRLGVQRHLNLSLGALLLLFALCSLLLGSEAISLLQALRESLDATPGVAGLILTELRLPRTGVALVAGASLGLCGALMQSLLRNPLASPGLIGSANGAALGAVICLYSGLAGLAGFILPLGGMFGALLATFLVYLLAGRESSSLTLILAGVAVNALAMALISLLLNLASSPYAVQEIALWMLGSLANLSRNEFWLLLPGSLLGWLLAWRQGRALDLLGLGEETALSMGVDLTGLRRRLFLIVALAVGSAVSITGAIGFIGLVVPHLIRPLVGHQPSRLLLPSALGGALLLLGADMVVRLLPVQTEIKVGVVTALIGAPFFIWLIVQNRGRNI